MTATLANEARNPALERAIADNPYDLASFAVYADWLIEQGDPRGELMAAQIATETADDPELRRAALRVFARDRAYFLPLPDALRADAFVWRRGFIHRARVAHDVLVIVDGARVVVTRAEAVARLLQHSSARFLTELEIGHGASHDRADSATVLAQLAAHAPPSLRTLSLGEPSPSVSSEPWGDHAAPLALLAARLSQLVELAVYGEIRLGPLALPALTTAIVHARSLSIVREVARASWPRLASLELVIADRPSMGDLAPLLVRADLPALARLSLPRCAVANTVLAQLATAPISAALRELDLAHGTLSDQGAIAMGRRPGLLGNLERMIVTGNRLTRPGLAALRRVVPEVIDEGQGG